MEMVSSQETREIAFHSPRSRLGRYFVLFLFMDTIWVALLIGFLFVVNRFLFIRLGPSSLIIAIQIFILILSVPMLFFVIYLSSFTLFTAFRLISCKPVLLVTSKGISFRDLPMAGNCFLPWSEIASFSLIVPANTYSKRTKELCLSPKNRAQFLAHYHPLWRFFVIVNSLTTGDLISIPQWLLSTPVEEVLSQIQENFQGNLRTYEIQIPDMQPGGDLH